MYNFNPHAILPLILSIFVFIQGMFVYLRNRESIINSVFALFCLCYTFIMFGTFMMFISTNRNLAIYWDRFIYLAATIIPAVWYHLIVSFLKLQNRKLLVKVDYLVCLFFLILSRTRFFIDDLYVYSWGVHSQARLFHNVFIICFTIIVLIGLNDLRIGYASVVSPIQKNQMKYLSLGIFIVSLTGIGFLAAYNVSIYPLFYQIFGILFTVIIAYAIVRYRLMDVKVAITRTGTFIAVYTLVLGIPFVVAIWLRSWLIEVFSVHWWVLPLGLMAALATVGPFIYIYVERKAEERLLKEQRRYQETLKQASVGMTRIRNLHRLLDLITHIVTKTVRISYAAIYLYDAETDKYHLQVSRDKGRISLPSVDADNILVNHVVKNREPLVFEEVKHQMEDTHKEEYVRLEEQMRLLTAAVVIPSFLEDKFTGFIVLGDKISGQIYTPEDLNVFQVLASQAALAIENAQFYEDAKEMQEQIAQAEKMATVGTMADGLSHQINNRFYALSLIAGDTIDTIKLTNTSECSGEIQEMIKSISRALERIQANVMQGGEVVKGILKYTRKGEENFEDLTVDQILDGTLEMVQYKVKLQEIDIVRDYSKELPKIKGNLIQLQEAFFNFIDNAYDSTVERRETLKENGYRGKITISAAQKDSMLQIIIQDNGMGVKDENIKKIFTPFFTTKISARKGTGLGLYVIRRIITDMHKGKINFESKHQEGTRFILELPIAK